MTKNEFLSELGKKLSKFPKKETEERLNFYAEMIDDRTEEGLSEEMAVEQIGSTDDIARQILAERSLDKSLKKQKKKSIKPWQLVLIIVGSPVWLSVAIALFAVALAIYICVWAVVISLWAVFAAFCAGAVGGTGLGIEAAAYGNIPAGAVMFAASFVCAGLSIFMFFGCKSLTMAVIRLTKAISVSLFKVFFKKEEK